MLLIFTSSCFVEYCMVIIQKNIVKLTKNNNEIVLQMQVSAFLVYILFQYPTTRKTGQEAG